MPHCAIALLVALVISLVLVVARAQPRGNIPQVGVLEPSPQQRPAPCLPAFQQGLRDLGYVEGQNIRLDYRYAEGQPTGSPPWPLSWSSSRRTSSGCIRTPPRGPPSGPPRPFPSSLACR